MNKIPKKVEKFIRIQIAIVLENYDTSEKHKGMDLQNDVWNEKKFNKFTIKDFDKVDYNIIKPALNTLEWLRKMKNKRLKELKK